MTWRLAIGAASFALFAIVARLADPALVRYALAGLAAISLVAAVMPSHVLAWFRHPDNHQPLLKLIASIATMVGGVAATRRWLSPGATSISVQAAIIVSEIALILAHPTYRGWVKALTIDQWRAIDAETDRAPGDAGNTSWKVLVILVLCAVSLTLQEYVGDRGWFERWFPAQGRDPSYELKGFAWWSSWRVIGYVIMPLVTIVALRDRIRDYHLSFKGFTKHLWIYVLMFALITPAVMIASTTTSFRHTYPFYRLANRSHFDLWTWEAFYAAQFISLEIFFRGFLLHGLRRVMGSNAIFVMIVPYCMIHYGKPLPETLGAIGAGVILGTLAMRTKSIWGGVLIHIGVAVTMDVLALRGCPPFGSNRSCGG
jgi:membrane protease YdiL (CAAX protease family)